ncbi:BglG family transcription antiterminator LicT [Breznakia pachnodae]|uniref:Beta-glucoside operon transcriptional antiterminator n=1 Tax=Breznakia pachnodae TaxID=265178 RepID=A0ABU0E1A8_9FIRM|nr:PRD domain-containing protein [Breznakia pachnodae]MDQ0360659.1 beta-glucoside operon transcriptional antiterminator [Breznakia pachnodae]
MKKLVIMRIYNNNVIQAKDENDIDKILIGKGLGFNKKIGEIIDEETATQIFIEKESNDLMNLINNISPDIFELSSEIIEYAQSLLKTKFHNNIYLTLTDHLNFAIERQKDGIKFKNMMLWDLKRFYPEEYAVALASLNMVELKTGIHFPEDEAGYIVFHFVNAMYGDDTHLSQQITKLIQEIVQIIRIHLAIILDEGTMNYSRLITHLKYFAYRILRGERLEEDDDLLRNIKINYVEAYNCSIKIKQFIEKKYNVDIQDNELLYLTIHIQRILRDEKKDRIVTEKA